MENTHLEVRQVIGALDFDDLGIAKKQYSKDSEHS
jgi:hypothetical protein